jgi:membrane associated rhomboid family serine protease
VQIAVSLAATRTGYPTIGASAGVFVVLVSYALLFPQRCLVLRFPPIPIRGLLDRLRVLELPLGVSDKAADIAHSAHLGGMIGAIVLILYLSPTRRRMGLIGIKQLAGVQRYRQRAWRISHARTCMQCPKESD